jgi:hypothetical protein
LIRQLNFISLVFSSLILLLIPIEQFAQSPHPILRNFSGQVANNTIRLSWAIKGGNTCEGTKIQRSGDGLFFETVGEIGGVCGSPDFDVPYTFTDSVPLRNQKNYYRLELGTHGFSAAVSFFFVPLNEQSYNVIYDPAARTAMIYFDNRQNEEIIFYLITTNGRLITKETTHDEVLNFNFQGFSAGVYLLNVQSETVNFTARIPVY